MKTIILDDELRQRLGDLTKVITFVTEDGTILARFIPESIYQDMEYGAIVSECPFTQ